MKYSIQTWLGRIMAFALLWAYHPQEMVAKETAYDFLNLDKSASIAALGGNGVIQTSELAAFFYNPAVLSPDTHQQLSIGFQKHLLDINSGSLAYGLHLKDVGDLAIGIHYINYGRFDQTNEIGQKVGDFSAQDLALQVGGAFDVETYSFGYLRAGASLKLIYSGIEDYSSTAYALDVGAVLHFYNEHVKIGASILNVGGQLSSYAGQTESLPLDIRLGVSNRLEGLPVTITAGLVHLNEDAGSLTGKIKNFTLGAEWTFSEHFQARLGFNNYLRRELKAEESAGMSGLSAGFGLEFNAIHFDYALSSWGNVGQLHQLSLSTTL